MKSHSVSAILLSFVVTIASLVTFSASTQAQDYLTDQDMFDGAWEKLTGSIGSADLFVLDISPTQITAQVRPADGGLLLDFWTVERRTGLFRGDKVSGPRHVRPSGPVIDITPGFFAQSNFPAERFLAVIQAAEKRVQLATPGRVRNVRIARQLTFGARIGLGDIRWHVRVENERELGVVQALADGTILGADISHTLRGQNRNFLVQDDWSFDEVEQGFRNIVGDGKVVYEIKILTGGIEVKAKSETNETKTTSYRWSGGMFTNSFAMEIPNIELMRPGGNQPFALQSAGLAHLPDILEAARSAASNSCGIVDRAKVIRPRPAGTKAQTVWVIELKASPQSDEKCVVQLTPKGSVLTVSLPQRHRGPKGYLSGQGLLNGIADIQAGLGADAQVFEVTFRPDRVEVKALDRNNPSMTVNLTLRAEGLRHGMGMPLMMQTESDLIPLAQLGSLDPAILDRIMEDAVRRLGIQGAEVHRLKIWSGTPFWRASNGLPFVDVRVGVPPRHNTGGYVVFTLDGQFVEEFN